MRDPGAGSAPVSYQTVTLARGKHSSPERGVCVMELASMLAGEQFTDHPEAVCPVIGAFLRTYNDRVHDRWRQDLYPYAARVVGTRSTIAVECARAGCCREWARRVEVGDGEPEETSSQPRRPGWLQRWLRSCRRESGGRHAGLVFGRMKMGYGGVLEPNYERHSTALRLVDELIAVGGRDERQLDNRHAIAVRRQPAQTW